MKNQTLIAFLIAIFCPQLIWGQTQLQHQDNFKTTPDFKIKEVNAQYNAEIASIVLEIQVNGVAGKTVSEVHGSLDGAPVLGYVFPTTLNARDVGFNETAGIVALALTSHPDFDDTPLWDENSDAVFDNDGIIWHPHWVILTEDKRVAGGLAVKQFDANDKSVKLPPTNPGMPMYMDSPGYPVITKGNTIRVVVPLYRINNRTDFKFDGVTAYMQVNTSDAQRPMLGVYEVYSVASGNLSLPYSVSK
ncbi:hypothetical protein [Roseivirga sp. E12]|uniref:hypothetical protein n=1 Tax=Roseivirga sp. E12 TaxID=2819237 RepID=UPI001F36ECC8|nr:hypothetical protein [Roseivirga sp. E12]